jgi:3-hydroxyisobutyrate dehydrogenase-like beta-hydroxyacid dehydrogenase
MAGTVGLIGLGNMGGPMALNLVKAGFELVVCDVRPKPISRYRQLPSQIDHTRGAVRYPRSI